MEKTVSPAAGSAPLEVVTTRVLGAPAKLVFDAWTVAKHLARWWGPKGVTNPVCEADVRRGGAIRIHMRGPDGTFYPNKSVFTEVARSDRIGEGGAA